MTLDELVKQTRTTAPSIDPLDLLATAVRQQQELTELGEELLDHWVQHARAAGCTWTQIGSSLGVTKQAAQQRHSPTRGLLGKLKGAVAGASAGLFNRFDARARDAVVRGQEEARRMRHDHFGTEHLLLGLLAVGEGIAADALHAAGVDLDRARTEVEAIVGHGGREPRGHIPVTPRAKRVLEGSLQASLDLGHGQLGAEHVLLALLAEGKGAGAQALTRIGVQFERVREDILARLDQ